MSDVENNVETPQEDTVDSAADIVNQAEAKQKQIPRKQVRFVLREIKPIPEAGFKEEDCVMESIMISRWCVNPEHFAEEDGKQHHFAIPLERYVTILSETINEEEQAGSVVESVTCDAKVHESLRQLKESFVKGSFDITVNDRKGEEFTHFGVKIRTN